MKSVLNVFVGVLSLIAISQVTVAQAQASSLGDDLIGNLYLMKSVYSAEYAPAAWKKSYANYDLETQFHIAVASVEANPNLTLKDSREILKKFIYAMKDYHTSIAFQGTEAASLPLSIKGTNDRFFLVYIDRTKLPLASFPFQVGDEVVTFEGKTIAQAIADVQAQIPPVVPSTDKALAENYLTFRTVARGFTVPQGPVTLGVKPQGSTTVVNEQLVWDYTPESIHPRGALSSSTDQPSKKDIFSLSEDGLSSDSAKGFKVFSPVMNADVVDAAPAGNPYGLGSRKTFTPDLGLKIWESADTDLFYAYVYKNAENKLVGYIRIPSYEADDFVKAVAEFSRDITLFESTTDALVIDQVNNPGGSVFYLYALASMLTTQPLYTPQHRMAITQADVADALTSIQTLQAVKTDDDAKKLFTVADGNGYPISYEFAQFALNNARFIVNEWNAGRKLTNPYYIAGVDQINPAASHYSKPILLLTNHLDFSGGDFFPTIMQDNKRVTILGSRTAGAGGYVNDVVVPNNVGVAKFRCTESIAERINQNPIENLGVTPDVAYDLTARDYAQNYVDYVAAIQAQVSSLTTKK
jgi:hypothetical protein